MFKIHTVVTALAYKIGQLEKENHILLQKINTHNNKETCISTTLFPQLPTATTPANSNFNLENNQLSSKAVRKTYSAIAKSNQNQDKSNNETWVTPPQRKKHETLLKLKEQEDAKIVLKEIKQKLNANGDFNEAFKNIRQLKNGAIIVECHTESQQINLQNALKKHNEFQIKKTENTDPMLLVTGIEKGYSPETFIKEFLIDNPQIKVVFGEDVGNKIRYIAKRECRNKNKENWVLQTNPEIFKWIIKNDNLIFDLTKLYVREYTNLAMCFNCCLFGHVAKYCRNEVCPNCKRQKLKDRIHTARDPKCPAYLQKLHRLRQKTNYESESNHFLEKTQ